MYNGSYTQRAQFNLILRSKSSKTSKFQKSVYFVKQRRIEFLLVLLWSEAKSSWTLRQGFWVVEAVACGVAALWCSALESASTSCSSCSCSLSLSLALSRSLSLSLALSRSLLSRDFTTAYILLQAGNMC